MHSKPRGDFLEALADSITLEAQIVRISDAVAYLNHDLADAFRAGVISDNDLPASVASTLGSRHSERIDTMVCDIIDRSWHVSGAGSAKRRQERHASRFDRHDGKRSEKRVHGTPRVHVRRRISLPTDDSPEGEAARRIVRFLHDYFSERHREIPPEYAQRRPHPRGGRRGLCIGNDRPVRYPARRKNYHPESQRLSRKDCYNE